MKNLKNLSTIAIGDGISKLVAFITGPYLAIKLQPASFGSVNLVTAIYMFMIVFVQFGTNEYGILKVSPNRGIENINKMISKIILLRLLLLLFLTTLMLPVIFVFDLFLRHWMLFVAGYLTLFTFSIAMDWVYTSMEEMWIASLVRMLSRVIYAVCVFIFVATPNDAVAAILIQGVTELLVVLSLCVILFKRKAIGFETISFKDSYSVLRAAFPIFLTTVSVAVFGNIDVILLGWMKSSEEVGYYAAALKLLIIAKSIRMTLGPFIFPKVVKFYSISKEHAQSFLRILQVYVTAVAVIIGCIGFLYAPQIIRLLFGAQYEKSVIIFSTIIWVAFFEIISLVFAYFVFSINQKLYAKIIIASALTNIILNVIMIGRMGALGSAIAYVVSSSMISIICLLIVFRQFIKPRIWRDILFPIILGVASFYSTFLLVKSVSVIYSSVLGLLLFIVLLFLLKLVRWSELIINLGINKVYILI